MFHKTNFGVVTTVHHKLSSPETHHDSEFYQESTSAEGREDRKNLPCTAAPVKCCNYTGNLRGQKILRPSGDYEAFYRVEQCNYPHLNQRW